MVLKKGIVEKQRLWVVPLSRACRRMERLGEVKDPTVKFDAMREQKRAKDWK